MSTATLETTPLAELTQQDQADLRAMVIDYACGEVLVVDRLRATLVRLGMSVVAFEQLGENLKQRIAAVADIEAADSMTDEIDAARATADAAAVEYEQIFQQQQKMLLAAEEIKVGTEQEASRLQGMSEQLHRRGHDVLKATADPSLEREAVRLSREATLAQRNAKMGGTLSAEVQTQKAEELGGQIAELRGRQLDPISGMSWE